MTSIKKHSSSLTADEFENLAATDRRRFLRRLALAGAGLGLLSRPASAWPVVAQDSTAPVAAGKHSGMIVHNRRPGVLETPLELLREQNLTPKEILFVRNNQLLADSLTLDPISQAGWEVEFIGLVNPPRIVQVSELSGMEQMEVEMVLQCSGNGRANYARSVKTRGTQWQKGGVGNVRWKGVPFQALAERLNLEIDSRARFVAAEGRDGPPVPRAADFEHSIPLDDFQKKGILALEMNGEPIPAVHGGPVRLILPGYYGTMNVKWLSRLRFEAVESSNHNHLPRYRTFNEPIPPGTTPEFTFENSSPTWRQKIKSIIWRPLDGLTLPAGPVEIEGVAWNDGTAVLDSVEVSIDRGKNWRKAEMQSPAGPYSWYPWKIRIDPGSGETEIWSRAVDARGRTQPLDGSIHWNPSGYEWYGVDKVTIQVGGSG